MGMDFVCFYCGRHNAGLGAAGIAQAAAGRRATQAARHLAIPCCVYLGLAANRGLGAGGLEVPALEYERNSAWRVASREYIAFRTRHLHRLNEVA